MSNFLKIAFGVIGIVSFVALVYVGVITYLCMRYGEDKNEGEEE